MQTTYLCHQHEKRRVAKADAAERVVILEDLFFFVDFDFYEERERDREGVEKIKKRKQNTTTRKKIIAQGGRCLSLDALSLFFILVFVLLSLFFTFPWWITISVSPESSGLAASMSARTAETWCFLMRKF